VAGGRPARRRIRAGLVATAVSVLATGPAVAQQPVPPDAGAQGGTYPGQAYPGQVYPAQPYPPQSYPPQNAPAQAYPAQSYPPANAGGYPPSQAGAAPGAYGAPPTMPGAPPPSPWRSFFASTVGAVAIASGPGIIAAISQGIVGGIANWFARRNQPRQPAYGGGYPSTYSQSGTYGNAYDTGAYGANGTYQSYGSGGGYGAGGAYGSNGGYGSNGSYGTYPSGTSQYPSAGGYPPASGSYPSNAGGTYPNAGTYPNSGSYPGGASYPDASSYPGANYPATAGGYPPASGANGYPADGGYPAGTGAYPGNAGTYPGGSVYRNAPTMLADPAQLAAGSSSHIFAGVAYEVHVVDAQGNTAPVDPNAYVFRTGQRFVVYYRPSLPGQMEVFNVNAQGKETKIDDAPMAAGQLAKLGPYEFSGAPGEESLVIVMSPCSTPDLLTHTRDIVAVGAGPAKDAGAPRLRLNACGTTTRGLNARVRTRDIKKVGIEGPTMYALDPVSDADVASGATAPRRVAIKFRHQ
jgi:hypothetical protein